MLCCVVKNSHSAVLSIISPAAAAVWCREKMLLLGSTDYGQEMTGAQKLKKKHQRLENELESHEDKIRVGRLENDVLMEQTNMHVCKILQSVEGVCFNILYLYCYLPTDLIRSCVWLWAIGQHSQTHCVTLLHSSSPVEACG